MRGAAGVLPAALVEGLTEGLAEDLAEGLAKGLAGAGGIGVLASDSTRVPAAARPAAPAASGGCICCIATCIADIVAVAIISLALGIGANTAVFSLFNRWLLQPLPVAEPDRLVNLSARGPKQGPRSCGLAGDCDVVFSYPMFRDLERVQTPFTALAAHRDIDST